MIQASAAAKLGDDDLRAKCGRRVARLDRLKPIHRGEIGADRIPDQPEARGQNAEAGTAGERDDYDQAGDENAATHSEQDEVEVKVGHPGASARGLRNPGIDPRRRDQQDDEASKKERRGACGRQQRRPPFEPQRPPVKACVKSSASAPSTTAAIVEKPTSQPAAAAGGASAASTISATAASGPTTRA